MIAAGLSLPIFSCSAQPEGVLQHISFVPLARTKVWPVPLIHCVRACVVLNLLQCTRRFQQSPCGKGSLKAEFECHSSMQLDLVQLMLLVSYASHLGETKMSEITLPHILFTLCTICLVTLLCVHAVYKICCSVHAYALRRCTNIFKLCVSDMFAEGPDLVLT